ncbi:MAG: hypothetical protein IPK99_12565 [Flavobacteriales bacterium]|nr:hypothetical protein [Flavobacteriales bacterium]
MTHFLSFRPLLLAGGLLLGSTVVAQDDELPIPPERLQEIKAQKSAYLTQKMGLTPEESQKFWPVYNQYDKELDALRKERRDVHKSMRADGDVSEAEATAAIEKELASQQRELDLRKRYSAGLHQVRGCAKDPAPGAFRKGVQSRTIAPHEGTKRRSTRPTTQRPSLTVPAGSPERDPAADPFPSWR